MLGKMNWCIADFCHLRFKFSCHTLDYVLVRRLTVDIEQLQGVLDAIEELPVLVIRVSRPRAFEPEVFIVPVYELVALVSYAVVCICVVDDIVVHPVSMVGNLLPILGPFTPK